MEGAPAVRGSGVAPRPDRRAVRLREEHDRQASVRRGGRSAVGLARRPEPRRCPSRPGRHQGDHRPAVERRVQQPAELAATVPLPLQRRTVPGLGRPDARRVAGLGGDRRVHQRRRSHRRPHRQRRRGEGRPPQRTEAGRHLLPLRYHRLARPGLDLRAFDGRVPLEVRKATTAARIGNPPRASHRLAAIQTASLSERRTRQAGGVLRRLRGRATGGVLLGLVVPAPEATVMARTPHGLSVGLPGRRDRQRPERVRDEPVRRPGQTRHEQHEQPGDDPASLPVVALEDASRPGAIDQKRQSDARQNECNCRLGPIDRRVHLRRPGAAGGRRAVRPERQPSARDTSSENRSKSSGTSNSPSIPRYDTGSGNGRGSARTHSHGPVA